MANLSNIKIVFFGTSEFAIPILKSLIQESNVLAVVTQPDKFSGRKKELTSPPIKLEIQNLKSEISVLQFESLKTPEAIEELQKLNADMFIVAAYGKIIPQSILDIPKLGCINVHGSILPKYRGASPIHAALLNGDSETGNTIMIMDAQMDHGPLLSNSNVPIEPNDDFKSLETKMAADGAQLLIETLSKFVNGEIQPQAQDESLASYTKLISKEDGFVDFAKTATEIFNKWRAYKYWPGIYTFVNDKAGNKLRVVLDEITVAGKAIDSKPGQLVTTEGKLFIACPNDSIEIIKLTPEGKKTMTGREFLNGYFSKLSIL